MESFGYWRLCSGLSVFQTIMLILGYDPKGLSDSCISSMRNIDFPENYDPVRTAFLNAIRFQEIEASIEYHQNSYDIDIDNTVIQIVEIKKFLENRGFRSAYFFSEEQESEEYLDPYNEFYAPKLAAAINAWKCESSRWGSHYRIIPKPQPHGRHA